MVRRKTIQDIANELRVSRTTIYKVINGNASIKTATRNRILSCLIEAGYELESNNHSRKLPSSNSDAIGEERPVANFGFVGFRWKGHPYFEEDFSKLLDKGIQRAKDEVGPDLLNIDCEMPSENEPQRQKSILEDMTSDDTYDAVFVVPNDPTVMEPAINNAASRGVPIITVNRDIPTCRRTLYVGPDYVQSGRLAGELIAKIAAPGEIAVHLGSEDDRFAMDLRDRVLGLRRALGSYENIRLLAPYKFTDAKSFDRHMRQLLGQHPELSGIVDISGNLIRTAQILSSDPFKREHVALVGFDLFDETATYVKEGIIDAVVYQDLPFQSYKAISRIYDTLFRKGMNPDETIIDVKLEVVMQENVRFF